MNQYFSVVSPGIKYLILRVTNKCNASCSFCLNNYYQPETANENPELSVDEYAKVARKLKGLVLLNLSGGEPYLRPDLFDIADAFVVHSGAWLISSPTNGSFPERTAGFAERLLKKHRNILLKVGISIDGAGELHNRIRGVPSGYEKALETAGALKKLKAKYANLMVHAVTTVSGENSETMDSVIDEIAGLNLFDEHSLTLVRGPEGDTRATPAQFESYRRACLRLMARATSASIKDKVLLSIMKTMSFDIEKSYLGKRNSFNCQAGRNMLNINEQGDVAVCEVLADPVLGNLRDYDFDPGTILKLPASIERLEKLQAKGCNCHWDCAVYCSLLFGGIGGYGKLLSNMFPVKGKNVG